MGSISAELGITGSPDHAAYTATRGSGRVRRTATVLLASAVAAGAALSSASQAKGLEFKEALARAYAAQGIRCHTYMTPKMGCLNAMFQEPTCTLQKTKNKQPVEQKGKTQYDCKGEFAQYANPALIFLPWPVDYNPSEDTTEQLVFNPGDSQTIDVAKKKKKPKRQEPPPIAQICTYESAWDSFGQNVKRDTRIVGKCFNPSTLADYPTPEPQTVYRVSLNNRTLGRIRI